MITGESAFASSVQPSATAWSALRPMGAGQVTVHDGFWGQRLRLNRERTIPHGFDQLQRVGTLPPTEQFKAFARMLGLDQFAKQRGIPEAKMDACLGDKAALDQLVAMQKYANETVQIPGTPAFLLNGQLLQNAGTWPTLEPQLKKAGA